MQPDGWEEHKVGEVLGLLPGYAFKSKNFSDNPDDGLPLIRIRDILRNRSETFLNSDYSPEYLIDNGDVLVGMDGEFHQTRWHGGKALLNQRVCKIWSKDTERLDDGFMFYFLKPQLDELHKGIGRTTVKHLSTRHLKAIEALIPPIDEQRKIADVLQSVDEAITATQDVIDQTRKVKQGLLHHLLTRGIGHTTFKQTDIGEIPESWEVSRLDDITHESAFGPRFSSDLYDEEGNYRVIRTTDINSDWILNYETTPKAKLPTGKFSSHHLEDGDLLITRSGTCGIPIVFEQQRETYLAGAFLIRFKLDKKKANPHFIRLCMVYGPIQRTIQSLASGGVLKNLKGSALKTLQLPIPSIEEQINIVSVITTLDNNIHLEAARLEQLQTLKAGVMSDLLSGRVRVPLDNTMKEEAA